MVRRMSGKYKTSTVSHLKYNDNDITDMKDICNTLAEQFAFSFPFENYSDFNKKDNYLYNDVFTLHELKQAIRISRDTSITQAFT